MLAGWEMFEDCGVGLAVAGMGKGIPDLKRNIYRQIFTENRILYLLCR